MPKRENQVTVPLTPTLHDYVARVAEREDRTKAGAIRHIVAEAARRFERQERSPAKRRQETIA
jgi:hypothetical protein